MERENASRIPCTYQEGEKVMYRIDSLSKYGQNPWEGPYKILSVNDNGTLQVRKGLYIETVNIHLVKPYKE